MSASARRGSSKPLSSSLSLLGEGTIHRRASGGGGVLRLAGGARPNEGNPFEVTSDLPSRPPDPSAGSRTLFALAPVCFAERSPALGRSNKPFSYSTPFGSYPGGCSRRRPVCRAPPRRSPNLTPASRGHAHALDRCIRCVSRSLPEPPTLTPSLRTFPMTGGGRPGDCPRAYARLRARIAANFANIRARIGRQLCQLRWI
jgi:hypothetical protein